VVCGYQDGVLTCSEFLLGNDKLLQYFDDITRTYFHTSTYLIRADIFRAIIKKYLPKIKFGDTSLRLMLVHYGPFVFHREVVSVYRHTDKGVWSGLDKYKQMAWEIQTYEGLYRFFEPEYKGYYGQCLYRYYRDIIGHDFRQRSLYRLRMDLPRLIYFYGRYRMTDHFVLILRNYIMRVKKFIIRVLRKIRYID